MEYVHRYCMSNTGIQASCMYILWIRYVIHMGTRTYRVKVIQNRADRIEVRDASMLKKWVSERRMENKTCVIPERKLQTPSLLGQHSWNHHKKAKATSEQNIIGGYDTQTENGIDCRDVDFANAISRLLRKKSRMSATNWRRSQKELTLDGILLDQLYERFAERQI